MHVKKKNYAKTEEKDEINGESTATCIITIQLCACLVLALHAKFEHIIFADTTTKIKPCL